MQDLSWMCLAFTMVNSIDSNSAEYGRALQDLACFQEEILMRFSCFVGLLQFHCHSPWY